MGTRLSNAWGRTTGYLDTAAYGLPTTAAAAAMRGWVDEWESGRTPFAEWLEPTDRARAAFARLAGVPAAAVCVGTSVSQLVALVASSLRDGARVLVPQGEFSSLLFPFLAQCDRGVGVREVPRERLVDAIDGTVAIVAFSAVSSLDGSAAPVDALAAAAREAGALTVVDAAQACGWMDADWARHDAVVAPGFKWLCCPRGVAFMAVSERMMDALRPAGAGWFASEGRKCFHGGPLSLAPDARRLDVAPVWSSWGAAMESLDALLEAGVPAIGRHDVALADRVRDGLGQPPGDTPIVVVLGESTRAALAPAGVRASARPDGARLAFHLYNDEDDVERVLAAVGRAS